MKLVRQIFSTILIAALAASPALYVGCADQSGGAGASNAKSDAKKDGAAKPKKKKPRDESGSSAIGGGVKAPVK